MKQRILSLDILRGLTVAGMILVNNGYGKSFEPLSHSRWNGMTPCDLVFPFFLFIMGVSMYLSLSKSQFKASGPLVRKIVRRTVLLFFIGLAINWLDMAVYGDWHNFGNLRVWAVLQRIALSYGITSVIVIVLSHRWLIPAIIVLLVIYTVILLTGDGYAENAHNILSRVDCALFGVSHLYRKSPVDPVGLLGVIPSVAHVLIGFYVGMKIKNTENLLDKAFSVLLVAAVLIIGGYLLSFGLPLNKRIWSPSYVLMTCGLASALLGLLMYCVDIRNGRRWHTFFVVFGVNPLFLYVVSELIAIVFGYFGISDAMFAGISLIVSHPQTASLLYALSFVLINFLLGYALYRRKIIIKL